MRVKSGLAEMLKGGVIMDVTTADQARIAEDAGAVAATVYGLVRLSDNLPIFASIAGTLLLCDAWFDMLTSQPGIELAWAAVEALVAELPLAAFCFWIAFDAESVAVARRFVGASAPTGHSEATG